MTSQTTQLSDSLTAKFRNLQKVLNDLSVDAAMFYVTLPAHDDSTRKLFHAVSRIMAMTDQIQMSLTLMSEDIKTVESLTVDPGTAFWGNQLEESFEEWIADMPMMYGSKVH